MFSLVLSGPLSILMLRWYRKFIDMPNRLPEWNRYVDKFWVLFGVFFAIEALFSLRDELLGSAFVLVVLGFVVVTLRELQPYQPARLLLLGVFPVIGYSVLALLLAILNLKLSKNVDGILDATGLFVTLWLGTFVFLANRQKKSDEELLQKRQEEIAHTRKIETQNTELERLVYERTAELRGQKEALQQTLENLRAAQNQLIQSEKMASLGELTAGIAHEIQNPLNFVNNFSEVSVELIDELKEELEKPDIDAQYILTLADELSLSQQKIHHHGKRASAIVKSMLQHSRATGDERVPIDVNALCDEYMRLAYHGLRAKDNSFNCELITEFDPKVDKIIGVGQDIGRVLLNLFNNAFYSVSEKKKQQSGEYNPQVSVVTRALGDMVEIQIRDNGLGIKQEMLDKIYQPFFTTKPTGEGTGLGLSLSYDIITKGHGGSLEVSTQENEFAEFTITLPASVGLPVS